MDMFIGRARELETLEKIWGSGHYKACCVYGRRRIGKTSLLREFVRGKRNIFIEMVRGTLADNVQRIARIIDPDGPRDALTLFDTMRSLERICSEESIVVVLDEFPYLIEGSPSAASEVKQFVDRICDSTGSMLIVCGSSISMMKEFLDNPDNPLYGRFLNRIDLGPLSIDETRSFHPGADDFDLIRTYLTLGGIPMYHRLAGDRDYPSMVNECLFDPSGPFVNDPQAIIAAELKGLGANQMSVLRAISRGHRRFGEIVSSTGLSEPMTERCLRGLRNIGAVGTLTPMAGAPKQPVYVIEDAPTAFFFGVVEKELSAAGSGDIYRAVSQRISSFLGGRFEMFSRSRIRAMYSCSEIGSWWGAVPVRDAEGNILHGDDGRTLTETTDIDIVATVRKGATRIDLFAECKFTGRPAEAGALRRLERRVRDLKGAYNWRLALVSGSGFDTETTELAQQIGALLVGPGELTGRSPPPDLVRPPPAVDLCSS